MGLNVPKPPDVLRLYRDYTQHAVPVVDTRDAECLADLEPESVDNETVDVDTIKNELVCEVTSVH